MFALVDGNNFYVSCERAFRPTLNGRPVVVLSNNDGCAIARSNEAKALGIKMGAPWFEFKHLEDAAGLVALSANFSLYGDLSDRMMSLVAGLGHRQEVYSIDESFVDLSGIRGNLTERSHKVRQRVLQWTGIPCGIGIGPTKTLAKIANFIAKTAERKPGSYPAEHATVCNLDALDEHAVDQLLAATAVGEVWGVGRRIGAQLQEAGITTVLDLKRLDPATVRRRWSVVLERTVRELRGMPCIALDEVPANKKEIACTRSFGHPVLELRHLQEAITEFTGRAAHKLCSQGSRTSQVLCFIRTSPFRTQDAQYSRSIVIKLPRPSNNTLELTQAALSGLQAIYRAGHLYAKAGVMLLDLSPENLCQLELPMHTPPSTRPNGKLMPAIDEINRRYGRGTIQLASAGLEGNRRAWSMRQDRMSPGYTTCWDELAIART